MPAVVPAALALAGGLGGSALGGTALATGLLGSTLGPIAGGALGAGLGDVTGSAITGQPISPLGVGLSAAGGGLAGALGAAGSGGGSASDLASSATVAPAAGAAGAVGPGAGVGTSLADLSASAPAVGDIGAFNFASAPSIAVPGTAASIATPAATSFDFTAPSAAISVPGTAASIATPSLSSVTPAFFPISTGAGTVAPAVAPSIAPSIAPTPAAGTTQGAAAGGGTSATNDLAAKLLAYGNNTTPGLTGTPTITQAPTGIDAALASLKGFTTAHPLLTLGGGMLASQLLSPELSQLTGSGLTSQEQALLNQAQSSSAGANQLINSLNSGVLPPGAEASVDQALNADIANIQSRYASMGMSGSSAEAQDIANAQQLAAANKFSIAQNAAQIGLNEVGITQNAYNTLIQDQLNQQQQLQNAFSGFFNALGIGTALGQAKAA